MVRQVVGVVVVTLITYAGVIRMLGHELASTTPRVLGITAIITSATTTPGFGSGVSGCLVMGGAPGVGTVVGRGMNLGTSGTVCPQTHLVVSGIRAVMPLLWLTGPVGRASRRLSGCYDLFQGAIFQKVRTSI